MDLKFNNQGDYRAILFDIKLKQKTLSEITKNHEDKLRVWLKETNPFSYKLYKDGVEFLAPVVCEEYSAKMQLEIFKIDVGSLVSPILDIGCGKSGYLVNFLRFFARIYDHFRGDRHLCLAKTFRILTTQGFEK